MTGILGFLLKKGAVFGKLSQLNHINLFANKKGAMFGLDARIALAIFGALSVISGASLYSGIKTSKTTAQYQSIKEVEKAIAAYVIDVGNMAEYDFIYDIIELNCLVENDPNCDAPDALWRGPYIGDVTTSVYWLLDHRVTGDKEFDEKLEGSRFAGSKWTGTSSDNPNPCNGADCYIYLGYTDEFAAVGLNEPHMVEMINEMFTRFDEHVDSGDGPREGRIRKAAPPNPAASVGIYIKTDITDTQG